MLFFGWQGIYIFIGICIIVSLVIMFFAKKLNREPVEIDQNLSFNKLEHNHI